MFGMRDYERDLDSELSQDLAEQIDSYGRLRQLYQQNTLLLAEAVTIIDSNGHMKADQCSPALIDWFNTYKEEAKQHAIAVALHKLTPYEKELLGLIKKQK